MPYSTRCLAKTPIHQQLHINDDTRVFIISDLDADFKKLAGALESVNFDYDDDTLIMLGDVIDRGNDSVKLIKHIIKHNFIMLLGNHEHMMLASLIDKDNEAFQLWVKNGGEWHFDETQEDLLLVCDYLQTCPITVKLNYKDKVIGLSHTAPLICDWHMQTTAKTDKNIEQTVQHFLWDRSRVQTQSTQLNPGVLFSIHGHNTTQAPYWLGNTYHIDTNYLAGKPSIISLAELIKLYCK